MGVSIRGKGRGIKLDALYVFPVHDIPYFGQHRIIETSTRVTRNIAFKVEIR